MTSGAGIAGLGVCFPPGRRAVGDVFRDEGLRLLPAVHLALGIDEVPVCAGETGSALALDAARQALAQAGVKASEVDVIVDFTVRPQEYLVPSWSMGNRLQHELGAERAFTVGFSGADATGLLVALRFAADLVATDERVHTLLLVGAEVAIAGNRVLCPERPVTVLGDGASAVVVRRGAPLRIVATELASCGELHDVCYIPGGAMASPDREDLYRLVLDRERYDRAPRAETLRSLAARVLDRAGLARARCLFPNLSRADLAECAAAVGAEAGDGEDRRRHGHVHGADLVLNLRSLVLAEAQVGSALDVLLCSHGMGASSGVTLLRREEPSFGAPSVAEALPPSAAPASVGIRASAVWLPPLTKTAAEVFRDEDLPTTPLVADVDFQRDLGIERVHLGGDLMPSGIALAAARAALEQSGLDPLDLDLLVDFTSIPEDHPAPTWSAAGFVQRELGATRAFATAVNTGGCASYHVALKVALAWLSAHEHARYALLFAGDKTPALNKAYYPITVTCDGGSAVVLQKGHDRQRILAVEVATLGELHDVWYVPGLAHRRPGSAAEEHLHMRSDLARFQTGVIPINLFMFRRVMRAAAKRAGVKLGEVAHYVYPSFSTWDQASFCAGLQIPPERVYRAGLARRGHLQENDMVANYVDAVQEGDVRPGDLVMVTTNGAGFVWGAALVRH